MGPQYENYFTLPFWHLEFGSSSQILNSLCTSVTFLTGSDVFRAPSVLLSVVKLLKCNRLGLHTWDDEYVKRIGNNGEGSRRGLFQYSILVFT